MEISAIALHLAITIVGVAWIVERLGAYEPWFGWTLGVSMIVAGWIISDFTSGFVHWLGDTFGYEEMPYLGEGFVKPFRYHHVDPKDICRHDFIETNGNNCIVVVLFLLLPMTVLYIFDDSPVRIWFEGTGLMLGFATFMTNQIHAWAHADECPLVVRILQKSGIFLSPEHHDLHHTPPYESHYCITNGWLNGILLKTRFFERVEPILEWTGLPKGPPESDD